MDNVRAYDVEKGISSVGVNKDDLDIKLDGLQMRSYSSQGQQRSASLALKLAELDIIRMQKASDELAREVERQTRETERDNEREEDDPDKEPLEKQAEYARAASEQLERERSGGRAAEREPRFQENRSK